MTDGVPKNTGNAYLIKGASLPDSYAAFKAAIEAGTQGLDLNFNSAGWQVAGSLLSKANLLSDATAAKLDGVETPDAALSLLGRLNAGLGNEYLWEKEKEEYVLKLGGITSDSLSSSSDWGAYYRADSVNVNSLTGEITYANPIKVSPTWHYGQYNTPEFADWMRNKYFYIPGSTGNRAFMYIETSTYTNRVDYTYREFSSVFTSQHIDYLNSVDANAYPPAVSDGYTYTALGQIGDKVRIATGSYVGTGTFGSGNSDSLTFDFVPQCVLIQAETSSQFSTLYTLLWCGQSGDETYGFFSLLNKTLSWYGSSAANQKNKSGTTYKYVAFG